MTILSLKDVHDIVVKIGNATKDQWTIDPETSERRSKEIAKERLSVYSGGTISQYSHESTQRKVTRPGDKKIQSQYTYGEIRPASMDKMIMTMADAAKRYTISSFYNLTKESHFIDIGCGFGRQVIHAACRIGCLSSGIDIVKKRIRLAKELTERLVPNEIAKRISYQHVEETQVQTFDYQQYTHLYSYNSLMSESDNMILAQALNNTQWRLLVWSKKETETTMLGLQEVKLLDTFSAKNTGNQSTTFYLYMNTRLKPESPTKEIIPKVVLKEEQMECEGIQDDCEVIWPVKRTGTLSVSAFPSLAQPQGLPVQSASLISLTTLGSASSAYHYNSKAFHKNIDGVVSEFTSMEEKYKTETSQLRSLVRSLCEQLNELGHKPRVPSFEGQHQVEPMEVDSPKPSSSKSKPTQKLSIVDIDPRQFISQHRPVERIQSLKLFKPIQEALSIGIQGIINLGLTCWASVCFQLLNSVAYYLRSQPIVLPNNRLELQDYYQRVFVQPMTPHHPFVSDLNGQQDAVLAMNYLLDTQWQKIKQELTFIETQRVECTLCNTFSDNVIHNTLLSLPVNGDFQDCVATYMSSELEDYKCEYCGQKQAAPIHSEITGTGSFILISFKRFAFNANTQKGTKIVDMVRMSETLNIGNNEFTLVALVQHNGATLDSGHYITHVRRQSQWYKCDDTKVSAESIESVLHYGYMYLFCATKLLPTETSQLIAQDLQSFKQAQSELTDIPYTIPIQLYPTSNSTEGDLIKHFLQVYAKDLLSKTSEIYSSLSDTYQSPTNFTQVNQVFCDGFSITDPILSLDRFKQFLIEQGIQVYSVKRAWQQKQTLTTKPKQYFIRIDDAQAEITVEMCKKLADAMNAYRNHVQDVLMTQEGKKESEAKAMCQRIYIMKFDDTQDIAGCLYVRDLKQTIMEMEQLFSYAQAKNYKSTKSCLQFLPKLRQPGQWSKYKYHFRHKFYCKDLHLLQSVSTNKKVSLGLNVLMKASFQMARKFQQTQKTCLSRSERSIYMSSYKQEQHFLRQFLPSESQTFHDQAIQKLNTLNFINASIDRNTLWKLDYTNPKTSVMLFTSEQVCILKAFNDERSQYLGVLDKKTRHKDPEDIIKKYSLPGRHCHVFFIENEATYEYRTYFKPQEMPVQIWIPPLNKGVGIEANMRNLGVEIDQIQGNVDPNDIVITLSSQRRQGDYRKLASEKGLVIVNTYQQHKKMIIVKKQSLDDCVSYLVEKSKLVNLISFANAKLIFYVHRERLKVQAAVMNLFGKLFLKVLQRDIAYQQHTNKKQLYYVYPDGLDPNQLLHIADIAHHSYQHVLLNQKSDSISEEVRQGSPGQVLGKRKTRSTAAEIGTQLGFVRSEHTRKKAQSEMKGNQSSEREANNLE